MRDIFELIAQANITLAVLRWMVTPVGDSRLQANIGAAIHGLFRARLSLNRAERDRPEY